MQLKNEKNGYWRRHGKKALSTEHNHPTLLLITWAPLRYLHLCLSFLICTYKTGTASDRLIVRMTWEKTFSQSTISNSTKGLIIPVIIIIVIATHMLMFLQLERGLVLQESPQWYVIKAIRLQIYFNLFFPFVGRNLKGKILPNKVFIAMLIMTFKIWEQCNNAQKWSRGWIKQSIVIQDIKFKWNVEKSEFYYIWVRTNSKI